MKAFLCIAVLMLAGMATAQPDTSSGGHSLTVTFVDRQGKPIANVEARVFNLGVGEDLNYARLRQSPIVCKSGADGKARIVGLKGPRAGVYAKGLEWAETSFIAEKLDCEMSQPMIPLGWIEGEVVDDTTGEPIKNYTVNEHERRDGRGYFHFEQANTGPVLLTITAPQYEPLQVLQDLDTVHYPINRHTFRLKKKAGAHFTLGVFDKATGSPIAGATIAYSPDPRFGAFDEIGSMSEHITQPKSWDECKTDAAGMATLAETEHEPCTFCVIAKGHERIIVRPADRPRLMKGGSISVRLAPESVVTGVFSHHNTLHAGTPVRLIPALNPVTGTTQGITTRMAYISEQGEFKFDKLSPGTYELSAEIPGTERIARKFSVAAGERKVVDLDANAIDNSMQSGRITGIELSQDYPEITFTPQIGMTEAKFVTKHDKQGRFKIKDLPAGMYGVEFRTAGDDYLTVPVKVVSGSEILIAVDVKSVKARLAIKPSTGKTLSAVGVTLKLLAEQASTSDTLEDTAVEVLARSNVQNGNLCFNGNLAGRYELTVTYSFGSNGLYQRTYPDIVQVDNRKETKDLGEICVEAPASISILGSVKNEKDEPVPGARVILHYEYPKPAGPEKFHYEDEVNFLPSTSADDMGVFSVQDIIQGRYRIEVVAPDNSWKYITRLDLTTGMPQLTVHKPKAGRVIVPLVFPEGFDRTRFVKFKLRDAEGERADEHVKVSGQRNDPLECRMENGMATFNTRVESGQYRLGVVYQFGPEDQRELVVPENLAISDQEGDQVTRPVKIPSPNQFPAEDEDAPES